VMENFFGTLKSECFYLREFRSVSALRKAVEDYIHYYNNERISPVGRVRRQPPPGKITAQPEMSLPALRLAGLQLLCYFRAD
ncbi:IS3 family transposase, partial [Klebsiella pneumoniae]|uniref:IS3 family transposase n=1 Tax=Klebsiella pneumoniae TaxID=573 RepID=UPI001E4951B3